MAARIIARSLSITVKLPPVSTHKLDASILPTEATVTKEELLSYLKDMITIRRIEITSDSYYKNAEIRGFCHLSDGQEAIAVGVEAGVTFEDHLISAYRVHGQAYMRGESPHSIFAELFGRITGTSAGKGGSMHYYSKTTNFYGGNGIVGAQCPVGVGLAFALKYQKKPNVSITLYGDGAANQGQLYEASNMASLWKLPAIFICENNLYGMGTSVERASANTLIYTRGDPIPGIRVDAQNIFAVREIMKFSKKWALEHGPIWLEFMTYRYKGHSMSDPGVSYRKREEIDHVREERDPIEIVKHLLLENKFATQDELDEIQDTIKDNIAKTALAAKNDAWPPQSELFSHIYSPSRKYFIRNIEYKDSIII
jgi:pyruvate dehydrogenase E1 component alpha subunit